MIEIIHSDQPDVEKTEILILQHAGSKMKLRFRLSISIRLTR